MNVPVRWKEGAEERMAALIAEQVDRPVMVTSCVVVVDVMNEAGDADFLFMVMPGQRAAATLGLLKMAAIFEEEGVKRWCAGEED